MTWKRWLAIGIFALVACVYFLLFAFLASKEEKEPPVKEVLFSETVTDKLKEYCALFNDTEKIESFTFFTDPHLGEGKEWEANLLKYIEDIKYTYERTPTDFLVCGGDWIGNSDTQSEACYKLGTIDGIMNANFQRYYPVLGNHDTNYQGKKTEETERGSGQFTNETVKNLWYRQQQAAYYRFEGAYSDYYVLDTQEEYRSAMNDYKWKQIDWFANELIKGNKEHSAVFLHIGFKNVNGDLIVMAEHVGEVIEAYNERMKIVLNGIAYDFSLCTGHIDYVMSGHIHADLVAELGGIPLIATANLKSGGTPTFDLCFVAYDKRLLYLIRVGTGENRTISI